MLTPIQRFSVLKWCVLNHETVLLDFHWNYCSCLNQKKLLQFIPVWQWFASYIREQSYQLTGKGSISALCRIFHKAACLAPFYFPSIPILYSILLVPIHTLLAYLFDYGCPLNLMMTFVHWQPWFIFEDCGMRKDRAWTKNCCWQWWRCCAVLTRIASFSDRSLCGKQRSRMMRASGGLHY